MTMNGTMPLVSSAQNQEDIMLWRALRQVEDGFYIDVGAADPAVDSVTRVFYEHGWRGINLEPNLAYFAALREARPRDVNLPFGAGRAAGTRTFHVVEGTGLSTFDAEIAARHRAGGWTVTAQTVETVTLADICRRHRPQGPIHFLKIDVEGA
jgi:FkbM family methyltransferase